MSHSDENVPPEENQFEIMAEHSLTRRERFQELFEEWLVTPIRVVWSDRRTRVGSLILLTYVLMGTVGVVVLEPPTSGHESTIPPFTDPNYILGTNGLGQPILEQIVHATPSMLKMITAGAVFSSALGTVVGTVSGYKGGRFDRIAMTITDIGLTIPGLPLIIVITAIFEPRSPIIIGFLLVINNWAGLARSVRSQVLTIREESYVEAARCVGVSTAGIARREILPNIMPYIMISFVGAARYVIFSSVGLYFLGILPFTTLNWGVMLNLAYESGALFTLAGAHTILMPMLAIVVLSYGLILIAQGSDRLFNPRVRARHAEGDVADDTEEERSTSPQADLLG
ncbi:ABC transporter permease [Halosimplex amylolyticum]|uniref:ABC transporter permease n=1 Tax=Halosimplex amylolyticum TaxID=3396616 RepID=UPI003F5761E0